MCFSVAWQCGLKHKLQTWSAVETVHGDEHGVKQLKSMGLQLGSGKAPQMFTVSVEGLWTKGIGSSSRLLGTNACHGLDRQLLLSLRKAALDPCSLLQ